MESSRQCTTDNLVDVWITLRGADNGVEDSIHTEKKLRTETGNAIFVPIECIYHLRFGFRADDEPNSSIEGFIHQSLASNAILCGGDQPSVAWLCSHLSYSVSGATSNPQSHANVGQESK